MYYLQSRYYNPSWGRFINADDINLVTASLEELTDKNLFSYCDNNPVVRSDDSGYFWHVIVGAAIGSAASGIVKVTCNLLEGKKLNDGVGAALLTGALSGGLAATGVGLVGQMAGNAALSGASNAYGQLKNKGFSDFNLVSMAKDTTVGAIGGLVGGKGAGSKALNNLGKQTIKRTARKFTKQGIRAASREVKKAFSYYSKNAGYVYGGLARGIVKSNLPSIGYNLHDDTSRFLNKMYKIFGE